MAGNDEEDDKEGEEEQQEEEEEDAASGCSMVDHQGAGEKHKARLTTAQKSSTPSDREL